MLKLCELLVGLLNSLFLVLHGSLSDVLLVHGLVEVGEFIPGRLCSCLLEGLVYLQASSSASELMKHARVMHDSDIFLRHFCGNRAGFERLRTCFSRKAILKAAQLVC